MKKPLLPILIVLAIVFLALAIYYWVTPAGQLPHWVPGYEAGSKHIHLKHGLLALILAIGSVILAWFSTGKKTHATSSENISKD